jgi:uncharacterized protein DUF4349
MKKMLSQGTAVLLLLGLAACASESGAMRSPSTGASPDYASAGGERTVVTGAMAESVAMSAPGVAGDDESAPPPRSMSFQSEETGGHREQAMGFAGAAPAAPAPAPAPPPAKSTITPGDPSAKATAGEVAALRAPLLVYTAQITVAVFEVAASLAEVEALGRDLGGFLARRDDNAITIRVPSARFDEAVKRLEKVGDVLHRNVTAEDVTEEFRDLEVRLKSAHAVQARLTELLAKAQKVEESVLIEKELDRVTGEIDRIEGRMKFLRDKATFSTITVTFSSKAKESLSQGPFRLPSPWLGQLGLGRLLQL